MRPKIVVLDGYPINPGDNPWTQIGAIGELTVHERTDDAQLAGRCREADVILTNKTRLSGTLIDQLPRLKLIVVLATGYDIVDTAAARARGVPVSNIPEYATDSVAEHTIAHLLELTHAVGRHDALVKQGAWEACPDFSYTRQPLIEVAGLTLGLVGFGRIGRRVGDIARALAMRILACDVDRSNPPDWPGFEWRTVDELFAEADVISLHCPLTPRTRNLVDARRLATMKRSAYLINTSRGALVDEEALAAALRTGRIAGAGLDVVGSEPVTSSNPLLSAPNTIITPHNAWASVAARRRLMQAAIANVQALRDGRPLNVVNGVDSFPDAP